MLRLYIMRHAKSSWAIPGAQDYERELNNRGISDLGKIKLELQKRHYIPQQILCSPAQRTKQTLENISDIMPSDLDVTYSSKLYSSGLSEYIELIQSVTDTRPLMVIGHNPMCGSLAISVLGAKNDVSTDIISYKYPTGTVSVIDFDCQQWSEVGKTKGILRDLLIPSKIDAND